ncbi:MMPL family transporter [Paenibacillus wynnii]|uniref:MMPL family transporter n=1 Tax=Paenibacillus wynnii TaxID=268407 RepID=UPI0027929DAB|nr:MMPL family transporter [Paenibacillus wynnii]MDQ0195674.1 RND superfamily putative drug exporter [Paenibacillus wynnii]
MFNRIGRFTSVYPKTVILIWVVLLVLSLLFGTKLKEELSIGGFSDPQSESGVADVIVKNQFAGLSAQRVIVVVENKNKNDQQFSTIIQKIEDKAKVDKLVEFTAHDISFVTEKHRAYVYLNLNGSDNDSMKFVDRFKQQLRDMKSEVEGFNILISGGPGIYYDINAASTKSVSNVERIGLPIVFLLLLFVFRSAVAALLPLLMGVISILVTMAVIYFLTPYMQLSTLLTSIVTMLGLGVAIDYALFITQRFREEMDSHQDKSLAIVNAVASSGRSVFFAGLTIAISLISLLLPNTLLFRSVAVGGFVVVLVSILAAITLLPAILFLLGKNVELLKIPVFKLKRNSNNVWQKIITFMMKRTISFLILGLVLVSIFLPFISQIQMHVPVAAFNELPDGSDAKLGMEAVVSDFGIGNTFPIRILLQSQDGSVYDKDSIHEIYDIASSVEPLNDVSKVMGITSLNEQFNSVEQYEALYSKVDVLPTNVQASLKSLVSSDQKSTLLYVVPSIAPNTEKARDLVVEIRDLLSRRSNQKLVTYVSGETAMGLDYDNKIMHQIPKIILVSVTLTFLLLLVAFRSVLLPLKAIVLNSLVTVSSLGFLIYMFQNGHMPGTHPQALNVNTPILLFCILFGLSIDYEVIIVSRIRESYLRTGNNDESIVDGFVATAGMINGGAAIMITVFGVFMFADIQIVQELGVGLAFAILIDALIVRTIVVPLSMKLLGRLNWWLPFSKSKSRDSLSRHKNI